MPVYVATVPNQALLARAIKCDPKGQGACELVMCAGGPGHGPETDPFRDRCGNECLVLERGPGIWKMKCCRWAPCQVPLEPVALVARQYARRELSLVQSSSAG